MIQKTTLLVMLTVIVGVGGTLRAKSVERAALCKKYEGLYISYYDEIYLVKNCKRYAVSNQKEVYELTRKKILFVAVGADVIRTIPLAGKALKAGVKRVETKGLCEKVQGSYITYSFVDVYYVDKCKKRLFKNWASYQEHRRGRGKSVAGAIKSLTRREFVAIPRGEDMAEISVRASPTPQAGTAQAKMCKKFERKFVSYYSKVYYIEDCKKKLVSYDTARREGAEIFQELTSEQWLMLPDK